MIYDILHVRTVHALSSMLEICASQQKDIRICARTLSGPTFCPLYDVSCNLGSKFLPIHSKVWQINDYWIFHGILCSLCPMQCYRKAKLCTRGRARGRMGRMGRMELGLVGCEEVIKFMEGSEESSETSERTSPQGAKAGQLSSTTATNPSAGVSEMSTDDMSVHKHRQQCNLQWSCELLEHVLQGLLMTADMFSLTSWGARDVCGAEVIVSCNSNKREAKETVKIALDASPAPQPEWISLSEVFPEMSFFNLSFEMGLCENHFWIRHIPWRFTPFCALQVCFSAPQAGRFWWWAHWLPTKSTPSGSVKHATDIHRLNHVENDFNNHTPVCA